jgi:hypothetical protein
MHHSISVQWNQPDALFNQFIKNFGQALLAHPQEALHIWNLVYCVRACYVSWLHQFHSNPDAAN